MDSPKNGRCRVVVESVSPEIDCGRFAIKRVVGERVAVEAVVFADGHDKVSCCLLYRGPGDTDWRASGMVPAGNDVWRAEFEIDEIGTWRYTVEGWLRADLPTRYDKELKVTAERVRARYSTWYEFFPRSFGGLKESQTMLPYIAGMGFDVVYLPPIHPIGIAFRKGPNNAESTIEGDPGSPWGIGGAAGGHTSVHPELGTIEDFREFRMAAEEAGLEVALDIAFQCTPDHPWVREHSEWFRKRPDGSIQYAENPPKKYQDIYPLDFESPEWQSLWEALRDIFLYWIGEGVKIFRVDNPHTKSFAFWEWVIAEVTAAHPDTIFLAEAFTRPHLMYGLAKRGFSQSYTYFTWRNTREEITEYFTQLTKTSVREFFRPNLWPNTPDILPEVLQVGGRAASAMRVALAATLGASYGIYGPAFELVETAPRDPGGEEYLNSEKYELKKWNLEAKHSLRDFIARLNRIRRENPELQQDHTLAFHETDNPYLLCYSKGDIVVIVNLDWSHKQSGWVTAPFDRAREATDLMTGERRFWRGMKEFVELSPEISPVQILRMRGPVRTEKDFDYFF